MPIKEIIKDISPPWLATNNAEKFLYTLGLTLDVQIQRIQNTVIAKLPLKASGLFWCSCLSWF